jgi:nitrile hydratase subunit beta
MATERRPGDALGARREWQGTGTARVDGGREDSVSSTEVTVQFKPGQPVRVKADERPGHVRTPAYVRGKLGWIERVHGAFRNPETRAYGDDGLPLTPLYLVGFQQTDLWQPYAESSSDNLYVDIYQHWLEPS